MWRGVFSFVRKLFVVRMLLVVSFCLLLLGWPHLRAQTASTSKGISTSTIGTTLSKLKTTIRGAEGLEIKVDAVVNAPNAEELCCFDLLPSVMSNVELIKGAVFGDEVSRLRESQSNEQLSFRIPSAVQSSGALNADASLDIFPRDNFLGYTDYRRNINGDVMVSGNAPNSKMSFEEAVSEAVVFLRKIGVDDPRYVDGASIKNKDPNGKGFYHLLFVPSFCDLSFSQNVTGGGSSVVNPSYPKVSIAISDDGVFSVNGRFLYQQEHLECINEYLGIDDALKQVEFYINSGLLSNVAPIPIEYIGIELFAVMSTDGGYHVRPVWAFRSDPSKMKPEWSKSGKYCMNLYIYVDDGSLAGM